MLQYSVNKYVFSRSLKLSLPRFGSLKLSGVPKWRADHREGPWTECAEPALQHHQKNQKERIEGYDTEKGSHNEQIVLYVSIFSSPPVGRPPQYYCHSGLRSKYGASCYPHQPTVAPVDHMKAGKAVGSNYRNVIRGTTNTERGDGTCYLYSKTTKNLPTADLRHSSANPTTCNHRNTDVRANWKGNKKKIKKRGQQHRPPQTHFCQNLRGLSEAGPLVAFVIWGLQQSRAVFHFKCQRQALGIRWHAGPNLELGNLSKYRAKQSRRHHQKICSSTSYIIVCFCLSDWSHGSIDLLYRIYLLISFYVVVIFLSDFS